MKKIVLVALALLFIGINALHLGAKELSPEVEDGDDAGPPNPTILRFDTMAGVTPPYTGNTNPIRGINGGGLPWVISTGKGVVKPDGTLRVRVRGLVIPVAPFNGTNPATTFRAIVSCLSIDTAGNAVTTNVQTDPFPANTLGDSDIRAKVDLPHPCIAPIIFVASPGGAWFSATGF